MPPSRSVTEPVAESESRSSLNSADSNRVAAAIPLGHSKTRVRIVVTLRVLGLLGLSVGLVEMFSAPRFAVLVAGSGLAYATSMWLAVRRASLPGAGRLRVAAEAAAGLPIPYVIRRRPRRFRALAAPAMIRGLSAMGRIPLPLLYILGAQVLLSYRILDTAHEVEALYVRVGREMVAHWTVGRKIPDFGAFLSGAPSVYPVWSATLDRLGGLALTRGFSLLCMLGVTCCVYALTHLVFDSRPTALIAAGLYASGGEALFLGRYATFDAPSLLLIAVAAVLAAVLANSTRSPSYAAALAPIVTLAIAVKYVSVIFVPVVLMLLFLESLKSSSFRVASIRTAIATLTSVVLLSLGWLALTPSSRRGISVTSSAGRHVLTHASTIHLLTIGTSWAGIQLIAAAAAVVILRGRTRTTATLLLLASLIPFALHLYLHEETSFHKHVEFGMFFSAPLVGYAVYRVSMMGATLGRTWRRASIVGVTVVSVALTAVGVAQSVSIPNWGDLSPTLPKLRPLIHPGSAQYLVDDKESFGFYFENQSTVNQWTAINSKGVPFLQAQLDRGHYYLVIFRLPGSATTKSLRLFGELKRHYTLILRAHVPNRGPKDDWQIWKVTRPHSIAGR